MNFDRIKSQVVAIVTQLTAKYDAFALYPAVVVAQNADGTLDLSPDDERLKPGPQHAQIRLGLPGASVTVKKGSRVLLGFEGGDLSKPIATLWDASSLDTLTITAGTVNLNASGDVAVTQTGNGQIKLISPNPGGIVLGDGSGDEAPIARVGDLVTGSGTGVLAGAVIINGVPSPLAPGTTLVATFLGEIGPGGATIAVAD